MPIRNVASLLSAFNACSANTETNGTQVAVPNLDRVVFMMSHVQTEKGGSTCLI